MKKVANSLVAVSCGAVLAVYSAGYVRTQAAVDRFEAQAAERRREILGPPPTSSYLAQVQPKAPPEAFEHAPSHAAGEPTVIASAEPAPTTIDVPAAAPAAPLPVETPAP